MKKLTVLLLTLTLLLSMAACNKKTGEDPKNTEPEQETPVEESGGKIQSSDVLAYVKDREFMFWDLREDSQPWQITNSLFDSDFDMEDNGVFYFGYNSGRFIQFSEDDQYIFYPEKISENSYKLYYRSVADPTQEPVRIDSDIVNYFIVAGAEPVVAYLKEDRLYQYFVETDSKEKISDDAEGFLLSEDGANLLYEDSDRNLFIKYGGNDPEKLAENILTVEYVSNDLNTVCYVTEEGPDLCEIMYVKEKDSDPVKIAEYVDYAIANYESGEIYYTTYEKRAGSMMGCVVDDVQDDPGYDWLREELSSMENLDVIRTLWYYDGKQSTLVAENYDGCYQCAQERAVIVYSTVNDQQIRLSELESADDLYEKLEAKSVDQVFVAVQGKSKAIDVKTGAEQFSINDQGTRIYYMDNISDDNAEADLYAITVSGNGAVSDSELQNNGVYPAYSYFVGNSSFVYYKYVQEDAGDLYINGTKVSEDVSLANTDRNYYGGAYYFFTDWNNEKYAGTLWVYQDGKCQEISGDVRQYNVMADGSVFYLRNYGWLTGRGCLCRWQNGVETVIEEKAMCLVKPEDMYA